MPPGPVPATNGAFGPISHLDYLRTIVNTGTYGIPYLKPHEGLQYMQNMQYGLHDDETEQQNFINPGVALLCLLGDVWGATAGKQGDPDYLFGGVMFNPGTQNLPNGFKIWYTITGDVGNIDKSFGEEPFYNFGRLAFGFPAPFEVAAYGKSHWLEHTAGMIIAEAENPIGFALYLKKGLTFNWYYDNQVQTVAAGVEIAGTVNSAVSGVLTGFGTD